MISSKHDVKLSSYNASEMSHEREANEAQKNRGGPRYSTTQKVRDVSAYLRLARLYCETPRKLRSKPRAIEQIRINLREERGPEGKLPSSASMRRWLDFGVDLDHWPVFAQDIDKVAAVWDKKELDFDEVEGGGGPGPLLNAQNALSDAVVFTRKLLQRDDYLETAAKNPKVHVDMMGKLTEAVHKLSMTGAGPLGGRKPQEMSTDEAFELVCAILEAHPELAEDVKAALK